MYAYGYAQQLLLQTNLIEIFHVYLNSRNCLKKIPLNLKTLSGRHENIQKHY